MSERSSGPGAGRSGRVEADRFLKVLERAAGSEGVTLTQASIRDGVLTVEARRGAGPMVRMDVLPLVAGERYFLTTERYGVRYQGTTRPSREQEAAIVGLVGALRTVETASPAGLDLAGVASLGGAPALFTVERAESAGDGAIWTELLVRVTARCNQACPFCSGPPSHADADPAGLRSWLTEEVPRHPRPTVTLTGGEPTLWPALPETVAFLVARPDVVLTKVQTNAVTFATPARVSAYPAHGRLTFFVSFHAARPDLYDECTGTHGQFERAVLGIDNLLAAGHPLTLNLVVTKRNAEHLEEWVSYVGSRFAGAPRLRLHFSVLICPEHRPDACEWLVSYRDLTPRLVAAIGRARGAGLLCDPLLSSSHAAVPPCLLPEEERVRGSRGDGQAALPVHRGTRAAEEDARRGWVKAPECKRCSQDPWCLGLPRPYAARFGTDELAPIR